MQEINCTKESYSFLFSPSLKPVARVRCGEKLAIVTEDAFMGRLAKDTDLASEKLINPPYSNPLTGPIFIEGAEPGDTLVVKIHSIEPTRDWAVSCIQKNYGALVGTRTTRMICPALPERTYIYHFDGVCFNWNNQIRIPWEPFVGTIGTAPELESIYAVNAFSNGGNLDCEECKPGNNLYFPVCVKGAYFYLGDIHANQGNGEICGSGLEISGKVVLEFGIIKDKPLKQLRADSPTELICFGLARPLEDAARMACSELVSWLMEFGWDEIDAYQLLSQSMKLYVANVVNAPYCMVAKIDKEIAQFV